jgi:hypothetical protein
MGKLSILSVKGIIQEDAVSSSSPEAREKLGFWQLCRKGWSALADDFRTFLHAEGSQRKFLSI